MIQILFHQMRNKLAIELLIPNVLPEKIHKNRYFRFKIDIFVTKMTDFSNIMADFSNKMARFYNKIVHFSNRMANFCIFSAENWRFRQWKGPKNFSISAFSLRTHRFLNRRKYRTPQTPMNHECILLDKPCRSKAVNKYQLSI